MYGCCECCHDCVRQQVATRKCRPHMSTMVLQVDPCATAASRGHGPRDGGLVGGGRNGATVSRYVVTIWRYARTDTHKLCCPVSPYTQVRMGLRALITTKAADGELMIIAGGTERGNKEGQMERGNQRWQEWDEGERFCLCLTALRNRNDKPSCTATHSQIAFPRLNVGLGAKFCRA